MQKWRASPPLNRDFFLRIKSVQLFIFIVRSDAAGGDGFVDYFFREIARQRVVVRKLHVIAAARLRDGV